MTLGFKPLVEICATVTGYNLGFTVLLAEDFDQLSMLGSGDETSHISFNEIYLGPKRSISTKLKDV